MAPVMSEHQSDPFPGLTHTLTSRLPDAHILISDGHYSAAGVQLSQAVQNDLLNPAALDRAAEAAEKARCPHREGPFGGYDYGHNNPNPVEGGRYVIRDFRDPSSPDWGKWLHQTDDQTEHDLLFKRMTDEHILRAILASLFCGVSHTAVAGT
jgi:hypothetical protein